MKPEELFKSWGMKRRESKALWRNENDHWPIGFKYMGQSDEFAAGYGQDCVVAYLKENLGWMIAIRPKRCQLKIFHQGYHELVRRSDRYVDYKEESIQLLDKHGTIVEQKEWDLFKMKLVAEEI